MQWALDMRPEPLAVAPTLDAQQQRVVDHRSGPLLVLAGPGTGKTTTIVEAVVARLCDAVEPVSPDQVLVLTFGRRAAREVRDRVAARVGGGLIPEVATFHSYAYGLLRSTSSVEEYLDPPRLMSGAEEDARIKELITGSVIDGNVEWPADLAEAVGTLGFANEVRALLTRMRELGVTPEELARRGRKHQRPAWVAVAQLAEQEEQVMVLENVMDYSEMVRRAVIRARDPQVQSMLHRTYRAIFVDEYQDSDPLQVELLASLVGPATSIVAVGDPDQAIYAFRGADVRGLLGFRSQFRAPGGDLAPVVVLSHSRRFGPTIRAVASSILGSRPLSGLSAADVALHRSPKCASTEAENPVRLCVYDSPNSMAAHVADQIRRAHIEDGASWDSMAVLVRTADQVAQIDRALQVASVPRVVASDEIPLRSEPAVHHMLSLVKLATEPNRVNAEQVIDALTGPMGGLDVTDIRRLGRRLRADRVQRGDSVLPSREAIRELILGDEIWPAPDGGEDDATLGRAVRFTEVLANVRSRIDAGASLSDVLWECWTGGRTPHGWPERLREQALAGSMPANHDIDAVMALFDTAVRTSDRYRGVVGVSTFIASLEAQQLPAEAVAERAVRSDAVRILTAHRAKGLEWERVWVVGVQEGVWPDLRERGSLLRVEELTADGIGPGTRPADLLVEERNLFYVACTRARSHLTISYVDALIDSGDRPSRFVLDVQSRNPEIALTQAPMRTPRLASWDGLVADLRIAVTNQDISEAVRNGAAQTLAQIAGLRTPSGQPLVPLADPSNWWGIASVTEGVSPVRDLAEPIALSGSALDSLIDCPLQWFLSHEVHAEVSRGSATSFGSVVHAVAEYVGKRTVPAELEAMDALVDEVWAQLQFDARWQSRAQRVQARSALERFLNYHLRAERTLLGTEDQLRSVVEVQLPDGRIDNVSLTGFVDRIERDEEGRAVAIDLKTMATPPPEKDVPDHGQLGVYQLLLSRDPRAAELAQVNQIDPGGAALVQLRHDASKDPNSPKVQLQPALDLTESPTWVEERLGEAVQIIRDERFAAHRCTACRFCAYTSVCPAQVQGEQVLPS
ncbi:MAG: ATP-dependent helicase [Candidatus Nanopelagicales bacterium]|jgi:superfamily I DNA/RNA helicase/RecB family exonuclease|nr:ATP-dependent helicase [Candidatus Nanopelagicales bacterium]